MLKPASVTFKDGGLFSLDFDDIYFQPDNAYEESKYVFLDGNNLSSRFQEGCNFSIGELGFGTGLNFCATLKLWKESASAGWLTYTSFEQSPLNRDQLSSALALIEPVQEEAKVLTEKLPPVVAGSHLLIFPQSRVRLLLVYGEAASMLAQLSLKVDAWFLDGFAPAVNPDLWGESLFNLLAQQSSTGATFATYSAAGAVKRALTAAGFSWQKLKGFGKKRHMLSGGLPKKKETSSAKKAADFRVAIVGSGLAGLSIAYAFHLRSIQCTIFTLDKPCASENPHALLMPRPAAENTPAVQLTMEGFLFSLHFLKEIAADYQQHGALYTLKPQERMRKAIESLNWPVELMDWSDSRLSLPLAATVSLKSIREKIINIVSPIVKYENVESLDFKEKTIHGKEYDFILWAAGPQEVPSNQVRQVKLQSWQGAILHQPGPFSALSADCDDGYILQDKLGRSLGSLFKKESERASTTELKSLLLQKSPGFEAEGASVWEADRAATVDRLPVCGPIYQSSSDEIQPEFNSLEKYLSSLTPFPGVYQLQGLGSRGLSLAPLLGESLVSMMTGQPSSLSQPLLEAVHPARFWYRDLKRGKR